MVHYGCVTLLSCASVPLTILSSILILISIMSSGYVWVVC